MPSKNVVPNFDKKTSMVSRPSTIEGAKRENADIVNFVSFDSRNINNLINYPINSSGQKLKIKKRMDVIRTNSQN